MGKYRLQNLPVSKLEYLLLEKILNRKPTCVLHTYPCSQTLDCGGSDLQWQTECIYGRKKFYSAVGSLGCWHSLVKNALAYFRLAKERFIASATGKCKCWLSLISPNFLTSCRSPFREQSSKTFFFQNNLIVFKFSQTYVEKFLKFLLF